MMPDTDMMMEEIEELREWNEKYRNALHSLRSEYARKTATKLAIHLSTQYTVETANAIAVRQTENLLNTLIDREWI